MMELKPAILAITIILVSAAIPPLLAANTDSGGEIREFHIRARQYAYDPPVIRVNKGDEVHIRLSSLDVVHGFFLEGHDIESVIEPGKPEFLMKHPSEGGGYSSVEEVVFTANRTGKFRYRCSHTCGTLHPFMLGEMIVNPNYPFLAAIGAAAGVFIAMFLLFFLSGSKAATSVMEPASAKL